MNGLLIVNKPKGITSQQVVGRVRKLLGIKKIGHTGTLDPQVDGVLPLCIGNATRVAEYMLHHNKGYVGEVTFGYSTDTQDATGEIVDRVEDVKLTEELVRSAFSGFLGEIMQIPPAYSAVKVNGKRAYDLARKGEKVVLTPRRVTIYSLEILEMQLQLPLPRVRFAVVCSKGTYVRTLCHDLGQSIGIPSHMSALTRTKSGPFTLQQAHSLEQIEQLSDNGQIGQILLPTSVAVQEFPVYAVNEQQIRRVLNGMRMTFQLQDKRLAEDDRIRIEDRFGQLLAIYRAVRIDGESVHCKPEKVFKE